MFLEHSRQDKSHETRSMCMTFIIRPTTTLTKTIERCERGRKPRATILRINRNGTSIHHATGGRGASVDWWWNSPSPPLRTDEGGVRCIVGERAGSGDHQNASHVQCPMRTPHPAYGHLCMLHSSETVLEMLVASAEVAKRRDSQLSRSVAVSDEATGGRPIHLGSHQTVGERGRRRSYVVSPNSRQSRSHNRRRSSSHSQGRDTHMTTPLTDFVGNDVSKDSLDVHLLEARSSFRTPSDAAGCQRLLARVPAPGTCLIVLEATGRYEQPLGARSQTSAGGRLSAGRSRDTGVRQPQHARCRQPVLRV